MEAGSGEAEQRALDEAAAAAELEANAALDSRANAAELAASQVEDKCFSDEQFGFDANLAVQVISDALYAIPVLQRDAGTMGARCLSAMDGVTAVRALGDHTVLGEEEVTLGHDNMAALVKTFDFPASLGLPPRASGAAPGSAASAGAAQGAASQGPTPGGGEGGMGAGAGPAGDGGGGAVAATAQAPPQPRRTMASSVPAAPGAQREGASRALDFGASAGDPDAPAAAAGANTTTSALLPPPPPPHTRSPPLPTRGWGEAWSDGSGGGGQFGGGSGMSSFPVSSLGETGAALVDASETPGMGASGEGAAAALPARQPPTAGQHTLAGSSGGNAGGSAVPASR